MSIREDYENAFHDSSSPFLTWHSVDSKNTIPHQLTRGAFSDLSHKIGTALQEHGISYGDRIALCMGGNQIYDLAIRYAAALTGIIPVTVNWQADTQEVIAYKISSCDAKALVFDDLFNADLRADTIEDHPQLPALSCSEMATSHAALQYADVQADDTRIIIFTSGTTGKPKGVQLPYRSYQCNSDTFTHFLDIQKTDALALCCVNPLHHTNSTAMTDWALRRPGTELHLIERYSTTYWKTLCEITDLGDDRIIAPAVARHFDFIESLEQSNGFPIAMDTFKQKSQAIEFLLGSAPVGPQTVERLQKYTGRLPLIRFGSTETCLQVAGTPVHIDEESKIDILKKGWDHTWKDDVQSGYWIGRDHRPHTEVKVVQSITPSDTNYLQECAAGEPGHCITRGANIMASYVGNNEASKAVFADGWYTGLGDIVYFLEHEDGGRDLYWQSRISNLLIRGGSNYSCEYIGQLVQDYLKNDFKLEKEDYDLAVTGLRLNSEHEDECCVVLDLKTESAQAASEQIKQCFLSQAAPHFSKGCKPDHLVFASIPRNFKGALLANELRSTALKQLGAVSNS